LQLENLSATDAGGSGIPPISGTNSLEYERTTDVVVEVAIGAQ